MKLLINLDTLKALEKIMYPKVIWTGKIDNYNFRVIAKQPMTFSEREFFIEIEDYMDHMGTARWREISQELKSTVYKHLGNLFLKNLEKNIK